jgi:hypothetical protein
MNFKEITAEDLFGKGVTGLPDTPGLSTTDMQAKFDELVKDVMVPKFNALVRELAVLSGIESVTKELENTETSIPTGSAVAKYIDENGGNATVEEMTWAEYEAISEEEKMDGTLRVITDRKAGVRFGNADISRIGDGTVTGAISALSSKMFNFDLMSNRVNNASIGTFLTGRTNQVTFFAFSNPTVNPFSFNDGYVIAMHSGLIHTEKLFVLICVKRSGDTIETKMVDITTL